MQRRWMVALTLVVIVGAAAAAFALWPRRQPGEAPAAPAAAAPTGTVKFLMEQQWLIRMKLAKAEPRSVARQITTTGRVVPAAGQHAVVAPPVSGIITGGMLPRLGQHVTRGEQVAVIRQTPTAAEVAQIEAGQAQLAIEQTRLEAERGRAAEAVTEADIRMKHAREEFERARRLYERKAFSQRQLHAAEAEYRSAQSVYASAVTQRDSLAAGRAPSRAGAALTYVVTSPLTGTVVRVAKSLGAQVAAGEAIVEVINLDTVWVEAPIPERDLPRLSKDVRAAFTTPAQPGFEFTGRLVDLGAVVSEQSRTVTAVFQVPNPQRALRIGLQADVRLDAGESVQALMIPREAVLDHEGKSIVYVLRSGEEFERRDVRVGDVYGDKVAVLSGLKAGERVVTQGAYQIRLQELRPATPGAHSHET